MLRGRDSSRIAGFSDAVFGFTLTLLVVSLEVPENFADLQRILTGFPAFAVTFTLICWVWYEHYLLFRRYALDDGFTIVLNCLLLFIVVFYAYPMKFMFTRLISGSLLGMGPGIDDGMAASEARLLMVVYSSGFVALFATFMLLHWNALRQRVALQLDALATYDARAGVRRHAISAVLGAMSVTIAVAAPAGFLSWAGLIFFLLGPAHGTFGYISGRGRRRLEAPSGPRSETPTPEAPSAVGSTS